MDPVIKLLYREILIKSGRIITINAIAFYNHIYISSLHTSYATYEARYFVTKYATEKI